MSMLHFAGQKFTWILAHPPHRLQPRFKKRILRQFQMLPTQLQSTVHYNTQNYNLHHITASFNLNIKCLTAEARDGMVWYLPTKLTALARTNRLKRRATVRLAAICRPGHKTGTALVAT
jgi:hypothetical protein